MANSDIRLPTAEEILAEQEKLNDELETLVLGETWESFTDYSDDSWGEKLNKYTLIATLAGAALTGGAGLSIASVASGVEPPVTVQGDAEAGWSAYDGAVSSAGNATQNAMVVSNYALTQPAGSVGPNLPALAMGCLTVPWQTVVASIMPSLGVSVDATLWNTDAGQSLASRIREKIGDYLYDSTDVMPALVDENGQVYMDGEVFDALKDLLIEEGIGPGTTSVIPSDNVFSLPSIDFNNSSNFFWSNNNAANTFYAQYYSGFTSLFCNNSRFLLASNSSTIKRGFDGSSVSRDDAISNAYNKLTDLSCASYTYQNKTVYYFTSNYSGSNIEYSSSFCNGDVSRDYGSYAWLMVYGGYSPAGEFPEGTSAWEGTTVTDYTIGGVEAITSYDPTTSTVLTRPYYPVLIPAGDPGVSADPLVQPNPVAPTELPQIQPYISPTVSPQELPSTYPIVVQDPTTKELTAPFPFIFPDPVVVSDPYANPAVEVLSSDVIDLKQDVIDPIATGATPPIVFPEVPASFPSIMPSSSASGLIHIYNPTSAQMIGFGRWLWVTYADATIDKIWNNPFDGVISAHEIYCTPIEGYSEAIRSGFLTADVSAPVVAQRYQQINCGSVVIPEYYANYLDYSPYSKAHVYLPFIGIIELNVDDIVGHSVNITYTIDVYNGSCIAQITVAKSNYTNTLYQFSGNCAVDIPLSGGSQASIKAGMISAAAYGIGSTVNGIINGAAYGGGLGAILGGVTGAVGGISSGIANAVSQKSSVQHSGSFGASFGAMGIKRPYIIIHRPIQKIVPGYNDDYGFPAHKRVILGSCTGYVRCREVHVISATANDEEKNLIEQLLKTGVYVTE